MFLYRLPKALVLRKKRDENPDLRERERMERERERGERKRERERERERRSDEITHCVRFLFNYSAMFFITCKKKERAVESPKGWILGLHKGSFRGFRIDSLENE